MPIDNSPPNTSNAQPIPNPDSQATQATTPSASTPPQNSQSPKAQKPKNKLLPVVIILAILTLTGLGTSIYFGFQSSSQASEISNLKSQLDNKQPSTSPTPEDPETPSDENNENSLSQILAQIPKNLVIKSNDIAYTTSSALYKDYDLFAMTYSWSFYNNSGDTTIYWDTLAKNLNYNNKAGTEIITDFGPTEGTVIDIAFGRFGNGFGYECFLFLMDDGTVEYVPYFLAIKENNFRSRGKLEGISEIIKFHVINNAHNVNGSGGYRTVLAQRADGTFYDLSSTINKLNILLTE